MSLSGICVVHCLALPVAVSLLPMWTTMLDVHNWLHPLFAILLIPTTIIAGLAGYRRHSSKFIAGLLATGLLIILVTGVLMHEELGTTREIVFTSIGSVVLIVGHLMNWRARHNSC
ncbi:MAG: MerC domain-containing protein [Rhodothermales bacterium]|nr:MerC domain-containing protein [Rhodothermales bacterium]